MFKAYKQYCNRKDIDCKACLAKFDGLEGGYVIPLCNAIPVQQQAVIEAQKLLGIIGMRMMLESKILNDENT